MFLTRPSSLYKESFLAARKEIIAEGQGAFVEMQAGEENDFEKFCERLIGYETGKGLPEGYVNDSVFWLIDNDQFIGQIAIRHKLTDHLFRFGGHIGYVIAPAHRQKGYGTAILKMGLVEAAKLGIDKVLVTCNTTNTASAKIIEKNGGEAECEAYEPKTNLWKRRYWITQPANKP